MRLDIDGVDCSANVESIEFERKVNEVSTCTIQLNDTVAELRDTVELYESSDLVEDFSQLVAVGVTEDFESHAIGNINTLTGLLGTWAVTTSGTGGTAEVVAGKVLRLTPASAAGVVKATGKVTKEVELGATRSGKPRINFAEAPSPGWLAVLSEMGAYTRGSSTSTSVFFKNKAQVKIVSEGHGAHGDAGRLGTWNEYLVTIQGPFPVIVRIRHDGGRKMEPEWLVFTESDVRVARGDENIGHLCDQMDIEEPSLHQMQPIWHANPLPHVPVIEGQETTDLADDKYGRLVITSRKYSCFYCGKEYGFQRSIWDIADARVNPPGIVDHAVEPCPRPKVPALKGAGREIFGVHDYYVRNSDTPSRLVDGGETGDLLQEM